MEHRNNVNLYLFKQLAKVRNNKIKEKRSQEYQSMYPEYVSWVNPLKKENLRWKSFFLDNVEQSSKNL